MKGSGLGEAMPITVLYSHEMHLRPKVLQCTILSLLLVTGCRFPYDQVSVRVLAWEIYYTSLTCVTLVKCCGMITAIGWGEKVTRRVASFRRTEIRAVLSGTGCLKVTGNDERVAQLVVTNCQAHAYICLPEQHDIRA